MTARQFREWQLFLEMEPVGGQHEDRRWGLLLAVLVNKDRRKTSPVSQPEDWFASLKPLPSSLGSRPPAPSVEEQVNAWRAHAAATTNRRG